MTRRDYGRFAELLSDIQSRANDTTDNGWITELRNGIADIFAHDNLRFNREKFYRACEPKKGGKSD